MQMSATRREVTALDTKRAGVGLLVYSALLLAASLLLTASWVPTGMILAATIVCIGHGTAGLALVRRSGGRHALVATSSGLHVMLAVAWIVLLVRA